MSSMLDPDTRAEGRGAHARAFSSDVIYPALLGQEEEVSLENPGSAACHRKPKVQEIRAGRKKMEFIQHAGIPGRWRTPVSKVVSPLLGFIST